MLTDHERRISQLEGKLDSLATKELVLNSNADVLKAISVQFEAVNKKIDQQTELLRTEFRAETRELRDEMKEIRSDVKNLDDRMNDQDKKYTKLAGAAVAIGLILSILVGAANVFVGAVSAGILSVG